MGWYRLKRGSEVRGTGENVRFARASDPDPNNRLIEVPDDEAAKEPNRYERHNGPPPDRQMWPSRVASKAPPGPPTDADREAAQDLRSMTAEEQRERAARLRERADALEKAANESDHSSEEHTWEAGQPAPQQGFKEHPDDLDTKTSRQLDAIAEAEEITLPANASKADKVAAIRSARG